MKMKTRSPKRGTNSDFWRNMNKLGQKVERRAVDTAIEDNFASTAKEHGVIRRRRTT